MTYNLILLPRAQLDVDGTMRYLTERSPQGAIAWWNEWENLLADLRQRPFSFGLAPESSQHEFDIYQALFKTRRGRIYRALFAITGGTVNIMHVRGPGQDLVPPDEIVAPR